MLSIHFGDKSSCTVGYKVITLSEAIAIYLSLCLISWISTCCHYVVSRPKVFCQACAGLMLWGQVVSYFPALCELIAERIQRHVKYCILSSVTEDDSMYVYYFVSWLGQNMGALYSSCGVHTIVCKRFSPPCVLTWGREFIGRDTIF